MIQHLSPEEARCWFAALPAEQRIATLSPEYVMVDSLRDDELKPCFLGYRERQEFWLHGVHRSKIPGMDCFDHQSPYGYGGPVSNSHSRDFLSRAWNRYVEFCRAENVLAEFVRFHPLAGNPPIYGGLIKEDRQTVVVDVHQDDPWTEYSTRSRTAIRKAINSGLTVRAGRRGEITEQFASFYRAAMRAIGADDFYLFNDAYFEAFEAWPSAELLVCERNGEWLSAGLFLSDGQVMEYHLSATTLPGRNINATNLLLDAAARLAKEQGRAYLYLGGGTNSDADNPLFFFKQSFSKIRRPFRIGFMAFSEERYYALRSEFAREGKPVNRFLFYRQ